MKKKIAFGLTLITGLLLVVIGIRFFLVPEAAELAFGIQTPTGNDFSFHYIKAGRDLATGLAIILLLLTNNLRSLGIMLLVFTIVPVVDFLIVLNNPLHETGKLFPHLTAIVLAVVLGIYYLVDSRNENKDNLI